MANRADASAMGDIAGQSLKVGSTYSIRNWHCAVLPPEMFFIRHTTEFAPPLYLALPLEVPDEGMYTLEAFVGIGMVTSTFGDVNFESKSVRTTTVISIASGSS
jgi:hypothetical protein